MTKLFKFLKSEYLYWFIIILTSVIFLCRFGNCLHFSWCDIGREVYIPSEIANGKILYKEIINIYAPLSYYINALLIKLFSCNKIYIFIGIGYILSICTLIPIYKICKMYSDKNLAFIVTLLIIPLSIFFPALINWITPYSYPMIYSIAAISWSLYFALKYIFNSNNKYMYLSALFYGFSISCKYDYIPFIVFLLIALIYKKAKILQYINVFFFILVFPICSFIVSLLNGNDISSLKDAFIFIINTSNSKYLASFYKWNSVIPSELIISSFKNDAILNKLFFYLGYLSVFSLLVSLIKKYDIKFILLNIAVIILSIKSIFYVRLDIYGSYSIPFLYMLLMIIIYKISKNRTWIPITITTVLFVFYTANTLNISTVGFTEINTSKGKINIENPYYEQTNEIIKFIDNNTSSDDKILVLPEGTIFNYITDRSSDGYLFQLNPNNFEILGEEYILNRLKEIKVDYIIVHNNGYYAYKESDFINGWGSDIYNNYIKNYYDLAEEIGKGSDIYAQIYKRK